MTPEKQRIAIAETCGWKKIYEIFADDGVRWATPNNKLVPVKLKLDKNQHNGWGEPENWANNYNNCWNSNYGNVPDYLNDLNAMHEAEKALSLKGRNNYINRLGTTYYDSWEFCRATAAQRAEAFLRTIGKWEDNK
jgi:hypothetical protein